MKIATWNVNSIKMRLEAALAWLKLAKPDVVALQEIKCLDENFPAAAFAELGYNSAVHGQKAYNGVAILSRRPLEDVTPRLPGGGSRYRTASPIQSSDRWPSLRVSEPRCPGSDRKTPRSPHPRDRSRRRCAHSSTPLRSGPYRRRRHLPVSENRAA